MTGQLREGQTFTGTSRFIAFVNLVRLPHTVFALPFALIGVVLASYRHRLRLTEIGWVILAFTAARFAAMAFNRIVDRHIDAQNPRTSMRELPRGVLSVQEAWISVVVSIGVFLVAAAALNPLCLALAPLAILWVLGYSFTKRFTRWSIRSIRSSCSSANPAPADRRTPAILSATGWRVISGRSSSPSWC